MRGLWCVLDWCTEAPVERGVAALVRLGAGVLGGRWLRRYLGKISSIDTTTSAKAPGAIDVLRPCSMMCV